MDNERCPYCQTPYSSDLDENGNPFCDCDGSRIAELEAEIARLREALEAERNWINTTLRNRLSAASLELNMHIREWSEEA